MRKCEGARAQGREGGNKGLMDEIGREGAREMWKGIGRRRMEKGASEEGWETEERERASEGEGREEETKVVSSGGREGEGGREGGR